MRIAIKEIDLASERPIGASRAPGYRVHFTSDLVEGVAIFAPGCQDPETVQGGEFEAEAGLETVDSFRVLSRDEPRPIRITALATEGDFEVVGVIGQLSVRGDDATRGFYLVHAGSAYFYISSEDVADVLPEEGATCSL